MSESEPKGTKPAGETVGSLNGRGRQQKPSPDAAFDVWLQRGLHQMFDDVAREPIPPEILALIEADRKKD